MLPLDHTLNAAILEMAPRSFCVRDPAPETFGDIVRNPGIIYAGASDRTIYADRSVNWAMRAWHDATHIQFGFDFSAAGEAATCEQQLRALAQRFPLAPRRWFTAIRADVIGQVDFYTATGAFPADQMAWVHSQLEGCK